MADAQIYQFQVLSAQLQETEEVFVGQIQTLTAINFPSEFTQFSQLQIVSTITPVVRSEISQIQVLAAVRGRIANPKLRAWTFTLDNHDFYVLRLGDQVTLIYDVLTEQWVEWSGGDLSFWRPNIGMNWIGGTRLGPNFGSNVVVGDDTFGLLYFLDPDQAYDDNPNDLALIQQIEYERIVTGQISVRGRDEIPCYAVFLVGDNYGLTATDFVPSVQLEISDDAGKSYDDAGSIAATPETVDQEYSWHSLGQMSSPGRLFRISDNGLFTRIDSLDVNDGR